MRDNAGMLARCIPALFVVFITYTAPRIRD